MKPYWKQDNNIIYQGHVLEVLKSMADESVQMCVTSPPYWGLRDYGLEPQIWDGDENCRHEWGNELIQRQRGNEYGKNTIIQKARGKKVDPTELNQGQFCQLCSAWRGSLGLEPTPELFIDHIVQIFREVRRILRKDGTVFLNLGDSYASGGGKDSHGGGYRGGHDKSPKAVSDTPLCQPNRNPIPGLKPKDLCGIPWAVAFALRNDGWYLRSDIIWAKPNPMPESVTDRPTKAHEYLFLLSKSPKYYYDADAIREPHKEPWRGKGESDVPNKDKPNGVARHGLDWGKREYNPAGRNKRTVWTIATQPMPEAHFATFPEKLIEPCILAGASEEGCCVECGAPWERVVEKTRTKETPNMSRSREEQKGKDSTFVMPVRYETKSKTIGWKPTCKCKIPAENFITEINYCRRPCIVLDPFGGSMTTATVAHKHNRNFIMIELSKTYIDDIGIPRIEKTTAQRRLFK